MTSILHVRVEGLDNEETPVLLVHAFAASLRAWDAVVALLAQDRRVVRVDLLGHGASAKPRTGYSMREQAEAIVATLDDLRIERCVAVGHSGGGDVVVAMIEHHRQRVARAALLGTPPNLSYVHLPLTARAFSAPLLGRLLWATVTDSMIREGLDRTFAPEFEATRAMYGALIADLRQMTHRSYVKARSAVENYRKRRDLSERVADSGIPILVAFGDQDQWVDPSALDGWSGIAETELLDGIGHTPTIEDPARTAQLIRRFASASTLSRCAQAARAAHDQPAGEPRGCAP